ncbi:MAG: crotonobetainyl-CoA--carnitine CoA-transferase, partial [Acidobacteriota bacterium]|nr:crotonobetainyl-CoA--carnitine CoA-transferase [Acidobacteriota bacterium]
PIPTDQLVTNFPLLMRSSVVAKFLYINEIYQKIIKTPGIVMEFGVWWGTNIALFENLRAVYEPYNYTRRVVGFDTFTGYTAITEKDGTSDFVSEGAYSVSKDYLDYLYQVLDYHQGENTMSHIKKYELVKGDATKTINGYLEKHTETIIALAYFDMQLYEPTKKCLEAIRPYLTRGSVIAMDELNCEEFPGETVAFKEVFGLDKYKIVRSEFLPDRSYIIID